jgi:SAM-dependent methyltransferase
VTVTMAALQEAAHGADHDYISGSPHLQHARLNARIRATLTASLNELTERLGRRPRVLEVGAGHGTFTETILATGAEVVVTEMSAPSAATLDARFRHNPSVEVVHDPDGDFTAVGEVDAVVYTAVLHHIPDYLANIDAAVTHIREGGALLAFQDPLYYPRLPRRTLLASLVAFYSWRLGQGDYRRGVATIGRRLRGHYDESQVSDMSEYHVVRQGVDEQAIADRLRGDFADVEIQRYWSTPSSLAQTVGDRLRTPNTFAVLAHRRAADDERRPSRDPIAML